jgi:hypothetical protein
VVAHNKGTLPARSHENSTFCIDHAAEINKCSADSGAVDFAGSWC